MNCGKCNNEIPDGSKFCRVCGNEIMNVDTVVEAVGETEPKENNLVKSTTSSKKFNKKHLIAIGILAVVLIGAIGIISNFYLSRDRTIKAFAATLAGDENNFKQYILTDDEPAYSQLVSQGNEIIKNKTVNKVDSFLKQIDTLGKNVADKNKRDLGSTLKGLEAKNTSRATDEELKQISDLKSNIETEVNQGKFLDANNNIVKLQAIINVVSVVYDNLNISVEQVDTSEYPKIKLYVSVKDKDTDQAVMGLDQKFFLLSEKLANNSEYLKREIQKVAQLDQKESLNINMVADVSDSMSGPPLDSAKYTMSNFLNNVQFGVGDKVELTAFSNAVYTLTDFISDKQAITDQITNLTTGNNTSLYDALYASVNQTAIQVGAKCVIAFTDGMDNNSNCTPSDVITLANRYKIPIFIIGIGDGIDSGELQNIAQSTNGFYEQINDISDMTNVYQQIYRQNKQLYLLEYDMPGKNAIVNESNIKIDVQTREKGGQTSFTFNPTPLISNQSSLKDADPISSLMGGYLTNYIKAINNHDFSYIENYLVPGGSIESQARPYIMKNITEELLSLEIIQKDYKSSSTCDVTTRETYKVQNNKEPLHMRVLQGKYEAIKQPDGTWKLRNYVDTYKILSKISY